MAASALCPAGPARALLIWTRNRPRSSLARSLSSRPPLPPSLCSLPRSRAATAMAIGARALPLAVLASSRQIAASIGVTTPSSIDPTRSRRLPALLRPNPSTGSAMASSAPPASPWTPHLKPFSALHRTTGTLASTVRDAWACRAEPPPPDRLLPSPSAREPAPRSLSSPPVHRRRPASTAHPVRRDLGEKNTRSWEHVPGPSRLQVRPQRRRRKPRRPSPDRRPIPPDQRKEKRYVIKKQVRGATSSNGGPKDQLSPKHDLEGPSVVFGRRSCPSDQGVAWGKASQPGKLTLD